LGLSLSGVYTALDVERGMALLQTKIGSDDELIDDDADHTE